MKSISLNNDWSFKEFGSESFENVNIPHTPQIEKLDVYMNKQGLFEYVKSFFISELYPNQRVFIKFEAVMTNCKVYINKHFVMEHFGGYLPFCIDITNFVSYEKENEIYLIVDNHDDPQTPPGKPTKELDFLYYGGIYRDVELQIKPPLYLTDPLERTVPFGGTHIATTVNDNCATIKIFESIKSFCSEDKRGIIDFKIAFNDEIVAQKQENILVCANDDTTLTTELNIENPALWDLDNPNLYTVNTTINFDNIEDSRSTDFGIRTIQVNENGFYLNGKKIKLFGLNRGQQYPYIGIAASNEAQRREARLLKQSGVNCLRLAHYPQSPAFIDECDRLGILVIDPIPGWQFLGDSTWRQRLIENTHELVRRDRNHPCIAMYEVTPNETNWATAEGDEFLHSLHNIVKLEDSSALTSGDTVGRRNALIAGFDIPYSGDDVVQSPEDTRLKLRREFGDWCFGGNRSTSRCSRADGEAAMQLQTWNFQFNHNENMQDSNCLGDLIWEGIDHNRGYYPDAPISKSGIFDIFRIKKLSYQFVKSQQKAHSEDDFVIFMQALNWVGKEKLVFYSNCDKLELYADDTLICTKQCDNGIDMPFNAQAEKLINDNYWMTNEDHLKTSEKPCYLAMHTKSCLFDGGNCTHIDYPPYTFDNLQLNNVGSIKVNGYYNDKLVSKAIFTKPSTAVSLEIRPQVFDIPLRFNNNDFVFVHVNAVDANGNIDTNFNGKITLIVDGGSTIGHSEINAEVGTAGFMVKAHNEAKEITITAKANNLIGSITL